MNGTDLLILGGSAIVAATTFETIIGPLIAIAVGLFLIIVSKA
jgi:hypothetical protein